MKMTEEQKRILNSPKYWEDEERRKKQIEYWMKHPLSEEEWLEQMNNRKAFIKSAKHERGNQGRQRSVGCKANSKDFR